MVRGEKPISSGKIKKESLLKPVKDRQRRLYSLYEAKKR
jgi:hypothetical protein